MFVGRENELTKLEKMYSTNEFQFAVIYGLVLRQEKGLIK